MGHMITKKTKVFIEMFGKLPIFAVYEVDSAGNKIKSFDRKTGEAVEGKAIVQFGMTKAKAVLAHFAELKEFSSVE